MEENYKSLIASCKVAKDHIERIEDRAKAVHDHGVKNMSYIGMADDNMYEFLISRERCEYVYKNFPPPFSRKEQNRRPKVCLRRGCPA